METPVTLRIDVFDRWPHGRPYRQLTLTGELDLTTAPDLKREVTRAHHEGRSLVLDLSRLAYVDSAGLAVLVYALRRYQDSGLDYRVVAPGGRCARIYRYTGLGKVIPSHDNLDEAYRHVPLQRKAG